ncbi:MAG: TetR/AcrR family transcriptional regulator [Pseudomonadota bacterium]
MPSQSKPKTARKPHHHGDLRAALVQAAFDHVRKDGAATFSLRHASSGAGVTSGAAYRHFASRIEVLNEVAVVGFELLSRQMHTSSANTDGAEHLIATGCAYLEFARQEPHLFALMFGPEGGEGRNKAFSVDFGVPNASDQLRQALTAIGRDTEADFLHGWGLAHGLAALAAAGTGGTLAEQEETIRKFALS